MHFSLYVFVNHDIRESNNPNVFFPIVLIYITNKIYPGNPHFMFYQLVQKLNDLNWDL